ncbi:centrosome and spindle pole-associated protein 1 isoform X2 [Conger conger]|uniref:centrosome and spindle pole-associated protein 1 isoform X2 n=1 Tax=Conger conger TaxID=82655 RepID=UPI002A59E64B|nr:centrosome and spindle pole-associated protein 1 isoform X2 [Conger conger]
MDTLHRFPEEDRIEKEKVTLDHDPPYMEIRTKADAALNTDTNDTGPLPKWSSAQKVEPSYGLSLPLGEDYEKKKQRLQEELRLDYRRYMAQKKDTSSVSGLHPQGLSLPIAERRSAKDRLRNERNQEYNQFLRGQRQERPSQNSNVLQGQTRDSDHHTVPRARPDHPRLPPVQSAPASRERPPPRRDAATLTESRPGGRGRRRWAEQPAGPYRRYMMPRVEYDSQDDYSEEEVDFVERRPRRTREPEYAERRGHRLPRGPDREVPRLRERAVDDSDDYPEMGHYAQRPRNDRVHWERRKVEATPIYKDDHQERNPRILSAAPNPRLQTQEPAQPVERAKSVNIKDRAEFATGLMIGAADGNVGTQARKERYRRELQEQMAEQQRNRRKEKELELRVAATGAVDPEKMVSSRRQAGFLGVRIEHNQEQPDRIKQFGAVSRDYEDKRRDVPYRPGRGLDALGSESERRQRQERPPADPEDQGPPHQPRLAFQAPGLYSSGAGAGQGGAGAPNQDFHRGLSDTLGEIMVPRITGALPPPPPTLTDAYRTPYDAAYYYYGARNPLDPSLAYYGPPAGGLPPGAPPYQHTGGPPQQMSQMGTGPTGVGAGAVVGVFPTERPKQSKESMQSYQEALRKQMQERQERNKQEKEEKVRFEAQLDAERRTYNPWGKGGGGAPLRDSWGNLITDLNRMHKVNEEAYLNPESRGKKAGSEDRAPTPHRISGYSYAQGPGFPRGNASADVPTPQQIHEQNKYSEYLKQQIEEKRQKEAQERERLKLEEKREEKRLEEQRACIQREYEEEQERKKRKEREQNAQNEEQIRLLKERREEEERRKRQEEERENDILRKQSERERVQMEETPRQPSPPIPAVQKRLASQLRSRPRSVESRSSTTLSERSMSVPPSPPVPARKTQPRTVEQAGVIGELSSLRKQLHSVQRKLDQELQQTERESEPPDSPVTTRRRERAQVDVFDMARQRLQAPVRRNSIKAAGPINPQNIREFNKLKYRDSESREEVRQAYPDPPGDDQSLELQQQALLREQQRRINRMKRREAADYFDLAPQPYQTDVRSSRMENLLSSTLLDSESAFIDSRGDTFPVPTDGKAQPGQRTRPPSARERGAERIDYSHERGPSAVPPEPAGRPDSRSLRSQASLSVERLQDRNQQRMQRLEELGGPACPSPGDVSSDDGDSLRPTPLDSARRYSVETCATEPWMRPGTSETLKRFMQGRARRDTHDWEGPSTYHG